MKRFHLFSTMVLLVGAIGGFPVMAAAEQVFTRLTGFQEAPPAATNASGDFLARINNNEQSIDYTLTYQNLGSNVRMAQVHLGQPGVNGGVSVWLCTTPNAPVQAPVDTPMCPQSGVVTRTIEPADVVGPGNQGLEPEDMAELIQAIRAGVTYANVHTQNFPDGEIRGQIQ
ncbi:MAG: CHRD domain-containing protein [Desulfobacteraceae bacterium]|nr:CHRD domain-containing protein [Desulfobacteraceae bacterium]